MSAVTAPVFPVEVIRLELTAAGAASFAVHYKHLQQLLCTRQVEQQWQHQYNQFLTLKGLRAAAVSAAVADIEASTAAQKEL